MSFGNGFGNAVWGTKVGTDESLRAGSDDPVAVIAVLQVLRKLLSAQVIEEHEEVLKASPAVASLIEEGLQPGEAIRRAIVDAITATHHPYRLALEVMAGLIQEPLVNWTDRKVTREARKTRMGQILDNRDGSGAAGLSTRRVDTLEAEVLARTVAHKMGFKVAPPSSRPDVKKDPELMSLAISAIGAGGLLLPAVLQAGLVEARITRFHPSREYYQLFREGRGSISDYVSTAKSTVEMVSINLATGHDMEALLDKFEELINRRNPIRVRVSLLDPDLEHLALSIAPVINATPETLRRRVRDTVEALCILHRTRLSRARREYLEVWCHNCLPNGSAIMLDGDSDEGLFQLETKGYRTGMNKSFGFEVAAGGEFFVTLRDSYRRLIADGRRVL